MSESAEQRFDQLWRDHAPAVVRYARRHVLPDDVEDAVATEGSITGSITCATGYVSAIAPGDVAVRLLPDRLPSGWSYAQIFARENPTARCVPPSLTALRADATGLVTGRISVTGPADARIGQGKLTARTVPDTVFGYAARRFDDTVDVPVHRWVWSDEQGRQWSAEVSGMPLAEARQALAAVSSDGPRIAWDPAAAPGWTLVHLREGAPYSGPSGELTWWVEMTDGSQRRLLQVLVADGPAVPLHAGAGIGERLTTVGGHPAALGHPRGGAEGGKAPGTETTPVFVELAPGTVAWSWATAGDLPDVEEMLASLQEVAPDDPRLARYGTD